MGVQAWRELSAGMGMPAGQGPSCQADDRGAFWGPMSEPVTRSPGPRSDPSHRYHGQPHWSLSALLLLVVATVAISSLKASGAERPKARPRQVAGAEAADADDPLDVVATVVPFAEVAVSPTSSVEHAVAAANLRPQASRRRCRARRGRTPQPNEVGQILILEYHVFTTDPNQAGHWVRTIDQFRSDLEWLYEHDFAVVPLRDVFLIRIAAPRGKHPVVLTFDDGTAGQFRFLPQPDGSLRVDPNSAVGVMEAMFASHPDFGRGGHFAVLPFNCFHVPDEPDQEPYCQEKLRWLDAHGYGVGNHTAGHTDLHDVDDATFKSTIGDAIAWAEASVPHASADILTLPFGNYPDAKKHPEQMRWLRDGFTYKGRPVRLLGALMVGGGPAPSPVSVLLGPLQSSPHPGGRRGPCPLGGLLRGQRGPALHQRRRPEHDHRLAR